jgi:hypothetical protein
VKPVSRKRFFGKGPDLILLCKVIISMSGAALRDAALVGNAAEVAKIAPAASETELNWALAWAALRGHAPVVKQICAASPWPLDINWALAWAAYGGHAELVLLFLKLGATAKTWAKYEAKCAGHTAILALLSAAFSHPASSHPAATQAFGKKY